MSDFLKKLFPDDMAPIRLPRQKTDEEIKAEIKAGLIDNIDYCLQAVDVLETELRSLKSNISEMTIDDIREELGVIISDCETAMSDMMENM